MRFSRRWLRLGLALAAFILTLLLGGPLIALFVWALSMVPLWSIFLLAVIVALLVLIVEDMTDVGRN